MESIKSNEQDFVQYYIIPTIVISATDNVLQVELKWWSFSFGFTIVREWIDN